MSFIAILIGYLLGSLPMGYFFVKLFKRQDITQVGSGRTGGTNAMRAGGFWVGLLTSLFDLLKGYLSVWIAAQLVPEAIWIHVLAGIAAVIGHNWSIWMYLIAGRFMGGAGTGPNVGAAMAFWPGVVLVAVPLVVLFVFVVGYASLASLSAAVAITLIFLFRTLAYGDPWQYVIYGVITSLFVTIALLPNIERLLKGNERRVGLFANKNKTDHSSSSSSSS
jgi:glycerol-3-phosphate acyltransferase PlsY